MKHPVLFRIFAVLCLAAVIAGLLYLAFFRAVPDLWPVLKSGKEAEIEAYLASADQTAGLVGTALLQFLQVISIVLPGAPIQIAAGIVYGVWKGTAICYGAYVAANLAVFTAVRKLGVALDKMAPVNRRGLLDKVRFLRDAEMPVYMTAMACLIPVVPNGVIPYAAARTEMRFGQFTLAVCLGSVTPIFLMCLIGGRILAGEYLLAVVVLLASLLVAVLLTCYRTKLQAAAKRLKEKLSH